MGTLSQYRMVVKSTHVRDRRLGSNLAPPLALSNTEIC